MRSGDVVTYFDGARQYPVPREAAVRQLITSAAAMIVLALLCVLESMFDAFRTASSGELVRLDLVSAVPRWTNWVLGDGVWWFALICAAQFVTFQVLSSPRLHHASHDPHALRNRFSVLMQGAAALTTGSWLLAIAGLPWSWPNGSGSGHSAIGVIVFTGAAAGLSYYLGTELRQYHGVDLLVDLIRSRDSAQRESDERANDFAKVPRDNLRARLIVSIGTSLALAFVAGLAAAAVSEAETVYPFWVRTALVSVPLIALFYMQAWTARNANVVALRGMQMFMCFVLLVPAALLVGAGVTVLLAPFLSSANGGFWIYATLAVLTLVSGGLVVATHFVCRAHSLQSSVSSWILPGSILIVESARANERLAAAELALTAEEVRLASRTQSVSGVPASRRKRLLPVLGAATAASLAIGTLTILAFKPRR